MWSRDCGARALRTVGYDRPRHDTQLPAMASRDATTHRWCCPWFDRTPVKKASGCRTQHWRAWVRSFSHPLSSDPRQVRRTGLSSSWTPRDAPAGSFTMSGRPCTRRDKPGRTTPHPERHAAVTRNDAEHAPQTTRGVLLQRSRRTHCSPRALFRRPLQRAERFEARRCSCRQLLQGRP